MASVIAVADAVVSVLNDEFTGEFIAQREYRPEFELSDLKTIKVTVVPSGKSMTQQSRALTSDDIKIDVAVQKKFSTGDNAELDPSMTLTEQIAEYFQTYRVLASVSVVCVKTEFSTLYAPEHLEQKRTFTSVVTLTFRGVRGKVMPSVIARRIILTDAYTPLSASSLVVNVEISAPPTNSGLLYIAGDDGSDVPWIPGEYHSFRRVDLHAIKVKGIPGDVVTLLGGTC